MQSGARRTIRLRTLLEHCGIASDSDVPDVELGGIEYDSRKVTRGDLFVAVRGFEFDGHDFVPDAAERGAVAALVEMSTGISATVEVVVSDTRRALGLVSHEFAGRPSEKLKTHAITGTNGKTTTSYLIDSILREAGMKTGIVGTLGYRVGSDHAPGDRTSPESLDLARLMRTMVEAGVEAVTLEVSSHALALGRAAGAMFDTATLTNLSRDHLDFHGSLAEYGRAKAALFDLLEGEAWKPGATAVLNRADELGEALITRLGRSDRVRVITYGTRGADLWTKDVSTSPSGTTATFVTPAGSFPVRLKLIAGFNVMNALAAAGVAVSQEIEPSAIEAGLAGVSAVRGRLEPIDEGQDFTVVVDYAHTPDALSKVQSALRELASGRIITVFGCGGDRDRGKRPLMGEIALAQSDVVIVTSDNPRTEDPRAIIDEILAGARSAGGNACLDVVVDRRTAIARAIELAEPGDVVLIAGKGHEDYQILGREKIRFDDREEAVAALARRENGAGSDCACRCDDP